LAELQRDSACSQVFTSNIRVNGRNLKLVLAINGDFSLPFTRHTLEDHCLKLVETPLPRELQTAAQSAKQLLDIATCLDRVGRADLETACKAFAHICRALEQLYEQVPGPKPDAEEAWRLTGGNPGALARLYQAGWSADEVVKSLIASKKLDALAPTLSPEEREWLRQAVEDPDTLLARERLPLIEKLVELNLIVDAITYRDPPLWIDQPPPERDLELGIGKRVAWQTPLHREAVRRALENRA
jgi:hypothetical protein